MAAPRSTFALAVLALASGHEELPTHNCKHDALHAHHEDLERPRVPQTYPSLGIEKRAGELPPSDALRTLRIHVHDGFLEQDEGHTCYAVGQAFSIGGASASGPPCSEATTDYCYGECTEEFVLTAEKRRFLQEDLVPELVSMVRNMLSVIPVQGGLVLNGGSCGFYGGLQVPPELTKAPGVSDADFVLFLTARPIYGDTIAYAGHCQTDQNGRPIAAHFNWSPSHFRSSMSASLRAYYLRVALHELTHALAFSPSLLVNFPRGSDGRMRSLEAIPSWNGFQRAVVTPRVADAARAHFGCDSVAGAHLEDGGGSGSAGSHWESRLYRDEYMTAAASPGPRIVSALTLALFEDSGWYSSNASTAEPLTWGFRAGCRFVQRSCADWSKDLTTSVDGATLPPYACSRRSADRCYYDQTSKAYCELKTYSFLPPSYRYFEGHPTLGGYSEMLDFCPVYRAYSNGNCADPANAGPSPERRMSFLGGGQEADEEPSSTSYFGPAEADPNQFCPTCRCFETSAGDGLHTPAGEEGHELQPGCFRMRCVNERSLHVHLGSGRWVSCPEEGGVVHVDTPDARARPTRLRCPPASRICALSQGVWPTISSVHPRRGPTAGGTRVTLTGTNLDKGAVPPEVLIGEVAGTNVTVISSTRLEFITGHYAGASSRDTEDVSVSDSLGRSAVLHAGYTYLPGWTPYAETLAICLFVAVLALWAVPRAVVPQLEQHAHLIRRRRILNAAKRLAQLEAGGLAAPAHQAPVEGAPPGASASASASAVGGVLLRRPADRGSDGRGSLDRPSATVVDLAVGRAGGEPLDLQPGRTAADAYGRLY